MMPAGIQAEKLAVNHVRQPARRMPVADVDAVERPDETVPRQPGLRDRIFVNVFGVVEVDEGIAGDRPVKRERAKRKREAGE